MSSDCIDRRRETRAVLRLFPLLVVVLGLSSAFGFATSVIPISDRELYSRADVIVHGIVLSTEVTVDEQGRPETLSIIQPLAVLKGQLAGSLVLHQLGGALPDGRFFKMWGKPEYVPGREVIVFAIARPAGEYETAEMLLGKFEVAQDEAGNLFAVPDLAIGVHPGVDVLSSPGEFQDSMSDAPKHPRQANPTHPTAAATLEASVAARPLDRFLSSLGSGDFSGDAMTAPFGKMTPLDHADKKPRPLWGNIGNSLYRWNNNATAAWTLSGTANIDGGGTAEAQGALAGWTNNPNSTINYTQGSGTSNVIYLNATSSSLGCGWSSCLSGAGVIGCGGPRGGGTNAWRGDSYSTITSGTVELRAYCSHNGYSSTITESVIEHELGHTLGLGHSDNNVSPHDVCRGDEGAAIMRSTVQNYTALGTDDQDAIRWIYGDGGNYCSVTPPPSPLSATATVSPATVPVGSPVVFTATIGGGTAPYTTTWSPGDGTSLTGDPASHNYAAAGQYTAQFVVVDAVGAQVQGGAGQVTVASAGDITPPTVNIASPANGATVSRKSTVTLAATASDNVGVTRVEFFVNGALVSTAASSPFSGSWKVPAKANATYTLQAKAYDAAGNVGISAVVTVYAK